MTGILRKPLTHTVKATTDRSEWRDIIFLDDPVYFEYQLTNHLDNEILVLVPRTANGFANARLP